MRLSFWPESILLKLATMVIKKLNWLTGKDNFWLSYAAIIIGSFCFLIIPFREPNIRLLVFVFLAVPSSLIVGIVIRAFEKVCVEETFKAAKNIGLDISFLILRLAFLFGFILNLLDYSYSQKGYYLSDFILASSWIAASYFASVEKPPYSRSQVLEWLNKALREVFCPRKLQPVPIRGRR